MAFVATLIGSTFADRARRRSLLLLSLVAYICVFGLMALFSGLFNSGVAETATGILIVVTVYLFMACSGLFGE